MHRLTRGLAAVSTTPAYCGDWFPFDTPAPSDAAVAVIASRWFQWHRPSPGPVRIFVQIAVAGSLAYDDNRPAIAHGFTCDVGPEEDACNAS